MAARGGKGGSPDAFGAGQGEGAGIERDAQGLMKPKVIGGVSYHPQTMIQLPSDTTHENWEGVSGGNYTPGQIRSSREVSQDTPGAGGMRRISKSRGRMDAPTKLAHDGGQVATALIQHVGTVSNWMDSHSVDADKHPVAAEKFAKAQEILTTGGLNGHLRNDANEADRLTQGQAPYAANAFSAHASQQLLKVHHLITSNEVRLATGSAPEPMKIGRSKKRGETYLDIPTLAKSARALPKQAAKTSPSQVINMGRGRKLDLTDAESLSKATDFAGKIDEGKVDEANADAFDKYVLNPLKPKANPKLPKPLSTDKSAEADALRVRRAGEQAAIDERAGAGSKPEIDRTLAGIGPGAVPSGHSYGVRGIPGVGRVKKDIKSDKPVGRGRTVKAADKVVAENVAAGKKSVADVAAKDNATIETVSGVSRVNQRTLAGGGRPDKENVEGTAARNKARTDELKQQSDKWDAANGVTKPERAPRKKRTGRLAKLRNLGK